MCFSFRHFVLGKSPLFSNSCSFRQFSSRVFKSDVLRLHERPAGPDDGSGWDVCAYTAADGAMGESKRWLIERHVRPITICPGKTGVEQTIDQRTHLRRCAEHIG